MGKRGPTKTTGAERSIRVQQGSALERLTDGQSFTEAVHRMAELFETALRENWGPQPVHVGIDYSKGEDVTVLIDDQGRMLHEMGGRTYVIGHDEHTQQEVDEAQLLALAREQYPSGLVPVGVDVGDDEALEPVAQPVAQLTPIGEVGDDEDWASGLL